MILRNHSDYNASYYIILAYDRENVGFWAVYVEPSRQ